MASDHADAIERAISELAARLEDDAQNWAEFWAAVRSLDDAFRGARFNRTADRQASWDRFQAVVGRAKERRDRERERAGEQLARAAGTLERLARAIARDSRDVVQLLGSARTELKAARGAPKEQLDAAWQRLKSLEADWKAAQGEAVQQLDNRVEDLRRRFDGARFGNGSWAEVWAEVRAIGEVFKRVRYPTREAREEAWDAFQLIVQQIKADRDERTYRSERIASEIRNTAPNVGDGGIAGGIAELMTHMLTGGGLASGEEDLKYQSDKLREAWALFRDHKDDLLPKDRSEVRAELKKTEETLNDAWADLKARKQSAWRERTETNLAKNRDKLAELVEKEARMRERETELEEKISSAWNDDFRERAEGWLSELREKLSSLREHIARVEGWIEEDEDKLSGS